VALPSAALQMIITAGNLSVAEELPRNNNFTRLNNRTENFYSPFFMPSFFKVVFHTGNISDERWSSNVPEIYRITKQLLRITIQTNPRLSSNKK
jgi:hypothetical protein